MVGYDLIIVSLKQLKYHYLNRYKCYYLLCYSSPYFRDYFAIEDFELELIHRDEINVTYIIQLLIKLKLKIEQDGKGGDVEKEISNIINTNTQLRSKRELIEKFISQNIPEIEDTDSIPQEFDKFWIEEQRVAFNELVKSENLSIERTEQLIENYLFAEREPLRDEVLDLIDGEKPTLLNRKKIGDGILKKIMDFVETFINGMDG